jgi:single-strand DNA-binding protein
MGINHITLMGTIVRGPESRVTPSGVPQATLSLAVTRPPRQEGGAEVTDYVRVVAWRTVAEKVGEAVKKGDLVVVEGRLTTRSYETQDGQRRKTVEVEASAIERVGGAAAASAAPGGYAEEPSFDEFGDFEEPAAAPAPRKPSAPASAPQRRPAPAPAPVEDLDDEIPF